jgi:hypothetical protein
MSRQKPLTDAQLLADHIHSICCKYDHTDQCGYYYSSWAKPGDYAHERSVMLKKAEKLLEFAGYDVIMEVLNGVTR